MSDYEATLENIATRLVGAADELEAVSGLGPEPLSNHAMLLKAVTLRHYALELRLAAERAAASTRAR